MPEIKKQIQVEQAARWLMALILLTAGISKFFSAGGFKTYYASVFANPDLRINLPAFSYEIYLTLIPFIEIGLGAVMLISALKRFTIWAWYAFMATLLVGHYILQEWSVVNQMLLYFMLGMICHILPTKAEALSQNA
jgi:uncharacterized membrane protein YphA (DoxX/SURF4 family)